VLRGFEVVNVFKVLDNIIEKIYYFFPAKITCKMSKTSSMVNREGIGFEIVFLYNGEASYIMTRTDSSDSIVFAWIYTLIADDGYRPICYWYDDFLANKFFVSPIFWIDCKCDIAKDSLWTIGIDYQCNVFGIDKISEVVNFPFSLFPIDLFRSDICLSLIGPIIDRNIILDPSLLHVVIYSIPELAGNKWRNE